VKSTPILFKPEMVRKILSCEKMQTRRVIRQVLCEGEGGSDRVRLLRFEGGIATFGDSIPDDPCPIEVKCPYGVPGDELWVRETWRQGQTATIASGVHYLADEDEPPAPGCWRPSIHMPRWACRIELPLCDVRCERLLDISEADAKAEGVEPMPEAIEIHDGRQVPCGPYRAGFGWKWNGINRKRATWSSNPWVWVLVWKADEIRKPGGAA
jgi:hypothetical protein